MQLYPHVLVYSTFLFYFTSKIPVNPDPKFSAFLANHPSKTVSAIDNYGDTLYFFCFDQEDLIILNGTGDSHTVGAYLRGEKNGYKINLYKPILIKCPPKQSSIQKTKYLGVFQLCLVLQMMWCLHIAVSLCILCSILNDLRKP